MAESIAFTTRVVTSSGSDTYSVISAAMSSLKGKKHGGATVSAIIVAKRENITHHQYANAGDVSGTHGFYTTTNTMYYVTFQMESGDRMEFQVSGIEYGMLAEGDTGELTFQGTRYLAFER